MACELPVRHGRPLGRFSRTELHRLVIEQGVTDEAIASEHPRHEGAHECVEQGGRKGSTKRERERGEGSRRAHDGDGLRPTQGRGASQERDDGDQYQGSEIKEREAEG